MFNHIYRFLEFAFCYSLIIYSCLHINSFFKSIKNTRVKKERLYDPFLELLTRLLTISIIILLYSLQIYIFGYIFKTTLYENILIITILNLFQIFWVG